MKKGDVDVGLAGGALVHTETLAILVPQLAACPQDGVNVGAMEEWAIEVLPVVARTRQAVLQLTMAIDGQDVVDDLVKDTARQTQETWTGVLRPRRIEALGEEDLEVCKSAKSVFIVWLQRQHSCRPTSPRPTSFISLASNSRSSALKVAPGFFLAFVAFFAFGFATRPPTVACFWGESA